MRKQVTGVEQETSGQEGVRDNHNGITSAAAEALFSNCQENSPADEARQASSEALRFTSSRRHFGFKPLMHFSAYLMIAAMVLLGLQLAYAFYQLASFIL